MKVLTKWLICVVVLLLTAQIFPESFSMTGGWLSFVGAGTVLWLLNIFIKPLLQVLSLPVSLLTLGLFSLVVNAAVVAIADAILPILTIHSFWICIFIALLLAVGNMLFIAKNKHED